MPTPLTLDDSELRIRSIPLGKEAFSARPFVNLKIGLQMLNGSAHDYDGIGRNVSATTPFSLYVDGLLQILNWTCWTLS